MKIKKMLFAVLFFILTLCISNNLYASSDLNLKSLDYDVQLNSDGTMDVVETWNIEIEDTNTLFKTFEVDKTKYKEIADVEVVEINGNGTKNSFTEIYEEQYHVDKDCFYALINSDGKFEIAWGAHAKNTTKKYQISYTVIDAVKNYNDCSEWYWQFISTESAIPADVVTGTVKLPTQVTNIDDLKVWAHGPSNGNIERYSEDTVKFKVENLSSKVMLETRIVVPNEIFFLNDNEVNIDKLDDILEEEQRWADEANRKREMAKISIYVFYAFSALIAIFFLTKIKKYNKVLKETPKLEPETKVDYYREFPDESETPAGVAFLYYFGVTGISNNIPKVISATMLDLCLKQYLSFEILDEKKKQIKIILNNNKNIEELPEDEKYIYNIFETIANDETNSFTIKEFEKYIKKHSNSMLAKFQKIEDKAKEKEQNKGNYDKDIVQQATNWSIKGTLYIVFAIFFIFAILPVIPLIINAVYCFKIYSRLNRLTQKGINEKELWVGLKKYMEDFSMIDKKEVPELVLWEKYLVYATVFGIADKVLKQLKVVYPQITDTNYMTTHGYTYMYLMYSIGNNGNFINSISTSINNTYSSINYSSGGGSGGGFSGGGGRRWRRRPEWAEDKIMHKL